jgi:hypothetical protein
MNGLFSDEKPPLKTREIYLPFNAIFEKPLLSKSKTWTTRSRAHGKKGDTFKAFGATFVLDEVEWGKLGDSADHFKDEGFTTKDDFIDFWCKIHPRIGYAPDRMYCVHKFHTLIHGFKHGKEVNREH